MAHLTLEETKVYADAVEFAELTWTDVAQWDQFARETVGEQLVRAADSIGANIAKAMGGFISRSVSTFCIMRAARCMNVSIGLRLLKKETCILQQLHRSDWRVYEVSPSK